jgi:hypothetical protein
MKIIREKVAKYMTEVEQTQLQALRNWYVKRKNRLKKFGWKYSRETNIHDDGTLVVVLLCGRNRHYLQVSTDGNVCFAPVTMVGAFY